MKKININKKLVSILLSILIFAAFTIVNAREITEKNPSIDSSAISANGGLTINSLDFSKTGILLASARNDGRVTLWNISANNIIKQVYGNSSASITGVGLNPDGIILATSSRDGVLRLWDISSYKLKKELYGTGEAGSTLGVTHSPNGKIVATAGADTKVMLWDATSMRLKVVLEGHKDFVRSMSFSPDSTILASSSDDGSVRIWGDNGRQLLSLSVSSGAVNKVVFSPKVRNIATGSSDGAIKEWNISTGKIVRTYISTGTKINDLTYSPDGSMLTGAGEDGTIITWRVVDGRQIAKVSQGLNVGVRAFVYSPISRIAASGGTDGVIKIWDTKTWKVLASLTEQKISNLAEKVQIANNKLNTVNVNLNQGFKTSSISQGPGGPVLLITSAGSTNPFGNYYTEILRTEGFNAFQVADISTVTSMTLPNYDIVILAEMALNNSQVEMVSNWVAGGGRLIAMRPDPQLGSLLGITGPSGTMEGRYLLANTTNAPGKGIVNQTIQYKGIADLYSLNGSIRIAKLYSDATAATANPAVTLRNIGNGKAAAFTYDLARSIIYMKQGNPYWVSQERDGFPPMRSDDLFYGAAVLDPQPDWINLNKVAIPQADEQQRLFANLIIEMTKDIKPLPRFWYLPRGLKAAIVMTGDDHANGGTAGRFDQYMALSPTNCSVSNWTCIRSTSYIYTGTPMSNAQALSYQNQGFEIGLHVNSNCADYNTQGALESLYTDQLLSFQSKYSNISPPVTNRFHCIVWDGWSIQPSVELNHSIRFDTNYYYWPPGWLADRPGFFTGSGIPIRFSDLNGNLVDVFNAPSQMTDESGQSYPFTPDTLLDRAIGPEEYFGVFTVNAHTDQVSSGVSDAVVASALARNIPIISSRQMLDWIDGRDNSTYSNISWNGKVLNFSVMPDVNATGLQVMVPATTNAGTISNITVNGNPINYIIQTINGISYAFVGAATGTFGIVYASDLIPPTITGITPASGAEGVKISADVTATFSEPLDETAVNTGSFELHIGNETGTIVPASVSYNASTLVTKLRPYNPLTYSKKYTAILKGGSIDPRVKDIAGNALVNDYIWSFTTASGPTCPCNIWSDSTLPGKISEYDPSPVELGVKFHSDTDGYITGIRFYKGPSNTGTHVGSLWSKSGTLLGNVTFTGEGTSGWQQANFTTPINVTVGTTYIASYHTNVGYYSADSNYFTNSGVNNAPLHALQNGVDGGNGVYVYSTNPAFPSNTWASSNYWVDVVFVTNPPQDTIPPTVFGNTPVSGETGVSLSTPVTATFNEAMNTTTINNNTFELHVGNETGTIVPAVVNYNNSTFVAKLQQLNPLLTSTNYTVKIKGGIIEPRVKDVAGNSMAANYTWSFSTRSTAMYSTAGWYAGDMHVHRSCGGPPTEISTMYQKLFAQNLTFMSLLADSGNGEVKDPVQDLPRITGQDDPISTPGKIVHWDAENHWDPFGVTYPQKNLGDHIVTLGLKEAHQVWEEYTYPIFNWAHQQNGIAGFAHLQYLDNNIPQNLSCCTPVEYPVEVALGSADFISEDDFGSDSAIQAYYRLLNTGFRPGFAGGTDYPCNNPNVGSLLTYAQVSGEPTYSKWIEAIKNGRTVVSRNGHNEFLNLTVNGNATPGDEINLTSPGNIQAVIIWTANQSLTGTIELVNNGVVVASKQASVTPGASESLITNVNFYNSGWLTARRMDSNGHQVQTGAVFVTINNTPVRASATDAQFYVQWMNNLLDKTSPGGPWNQYFHDNNLSLAQTRYRSAKAIYQQIANESGQQAYNTIWSSSTVPGTVTDPDTSTVELGVKFRSDTDGYITGIRFYKGPSNTGTHVGSLWSKSGTLLGNVTFTGEGTSGWQQANFTTPINVTVGTTYIASYHTNVGYYSADSNYFTNSGVNNAPLHALQNGVDGGNGVYVYSTNPAFPSNTWASSNYWVDVVFST